ncbi:MAG: autotransporter-associated beta strand repeat-containing protein [Isosphaeraceae bacterium]|nr:autotransporter-associated beta strand repeat-containing protein [Isosphaeraceae bacterium]
MVFEGRVVSSSPESVGTGPINLAGGTLEAAFSTPGAGSLASGFGGDGLGWTLESNTAFSNPIVDDALTLTTNLSSQARAAWRSDPVNVAAFTTRFTYTASGNAAADGLAFVIQNSGTHALGENGGSLGYRGIGTSVAVGLNLYAPNTPRAKIFTNGIISGAFSSIGSVDLASGNPIDITLRYDGTHLYATYAERGTDHLHHAPAFAIDIPAIVGGATAFIGLTAGTGAGVATQQISDFHYVETPAHYGNVIRTTANTSSTLLVTPSAGLPFASFGALSLGDGSTISIAPSASVATGSTYHARFSSTSFVGTSTVDVARNGDAAAMFDLGSLGDEGAAATLIKSGDGDLSFMSPTHTLVSGSRLKFSAGTATAVAGPYSSSRDIEVDPGATFRLATATTARSVVGGGTVALEGFILTLGGSADADATAAITDDTAAGGLIKIGTGTLTLSGANTYSGATTISAGTLRIGHASALGTTAGNTVVVAGASLDLNGFSIAEPLRLAGAGLGAGGALINNGSQEATISANLSRAPGQDFSIGGSANITVIGSISDSNAFTITKVGTNTLTLGGTGDNVQLGLLNLSGTTVLAKSSTAVVHAIGGTGLTISGGTVSLGGPDLQRRPRESPRRRARSGHA